MSAAARVTRVIFSSADQTWNTPAWFIDRLVRCLGPIGLDPCSNEWSVVGAAREVRHDQGEDGLRVEWGGAGLVFVNPPFGRVIGRFMDRCTMADECVALVPARVDTAWWQRSFRACAACVFWRGRFSFRVRENEKGNAPFPSSILYFGPRPARFLGEFARDGIGIDASAPIGRRTPRQRRSPSIAAVAAPEET